MTTDYAIFCAALTVVIVTLSAIQRLRAAHRARDEAERALSTERAAQQERSRRSVIETLCAVDDEQNTDLLETLQHHEPAGGSAERMLRAIEMMAKGGVMRERPA